MSAAGAGVAFFDFLVQNPDFLRILNEAEQLAPKGHEAHFQLVVAGYLASLQRDWARGEYPGYEERELEVIVVRFLPVDEHAHALDGLAQQLLAVELAGDVREELLERDQLAAAALAQVVELEPGGVGVRLGTHPS